MQQPQPQKHFANGYGGAASGIGFVSQVNAIGGETPASAAFKKGSIGGGSGGNCGNGGNNGIGDVAFHGLDGGRKIATNSNGGNGNGSGYSGDVSELRIDEKNISLHLNNPFVTNYAAQKQSLADAYHQLNASVMSYAALKNCESSGELNSYNCGGGRGVVDGELPARPKRPHSIAVSSPMMVTSERKQPMTLTSATKGTMSHSASASGNLLHHQPIVSYGGHYASPSRLVTSRSSQDFPVYATSNAVPSNGIVPVIPPAIVQRRSHSTPRPVHGSVISSSGLTYPTNGAPAIGLVPRPRSLDRSNLATSLGLNLLEKKSKPPPVPSRRFSQPLAGQTLPGQPQQLSVSTASALRLPHANGMRQSATFHGQMNRHAGAGFGFTPKECAELGARRKQDRPLSYAYGTMPDQAFLENQLKIYSEQLRTITESVRKYSEQAKLLSEMKRQQQQQQQMYPGKRPIDVSQKNLSVSDINLNGGSMNADSTGAEPQTPSHQLKLFLDNIRGNNELANGQPTLKTPSPTTARMESDRSRTLPRRGAESPGRGASKTIEAKTPSDQLRQFLDAIRSNQLPEEDSEDLTDAANRFSKFKENLDNSRLKSMTDFDKFQPSSAVSDTFNQVSDNLRIMNQDLEALARSPAKKPTGDQKGAPADGQNPGIMLDFNQILDKFTHLTNNAHSRDTIDYLRKCSEALRLSSNHLRITGLQTGNYSDSNDSSSCSTTPGSIRETVQNLLQQPRNGVLIMDDRMKLFIDILDTQSKLSQVNPSLTSLLIRELGKKRFTASAGFLKYYNMMA